MAGTPRFKIYNPQNEYVAACKHIEESAMLAACLGKGTTIRDGHEKKHIVWHEGFEDQPASESYDYVAQVVNTRVEAIWSTPTPPDSKPLARAALKATVKYALNVVGRTWEGYQSAYSYHVQGIGHPTNLDEAKKLAPDFAEVRDFQILDDGNQVIRPWSYSANAIAFNEILGQ